MCAGARASVGEELIAVDQNVGQVIVQYKVNIMDKLKAAGYSSIKLRREKLLGESYMSQLRRGDMVSWAALDTICTRLDCQPGDLIEYVQEPGVHKTAEADNEI